jgi:hypothetical protein
MNMRKNEDGETDVDDGEHAKHENTVPTATLHDDAANMAHIQL